jgi:lipoprotein signal peptidase
MSYTSIPNQPIIFNSVIPEACEGCNNQFAQLADFNDQLFWQLEAGQCGYAEFLSEVLIPSWTKSGSTISSTGSGAYIANYLRYDVVEDFIVTITVTDIIGILNVGISFGGFQEITAPGTHRIHLKTFNLTNNAISILFGSGSSLFEGSFNIDSVIPVPNGALFAGLVDAETLSVIQVLDLTVTTNQQYLTAAINLADYTIEPGCYRLAIADYCTNTCGQYYIYNPYFNSAPRIPTGWASNPLIGSDNWTVGGGEAQIDLTVLGNSAELVSITELCEGKDYYITIEVDSITNARLRFTVDGIGYGSFITASGTYSFIVNPTSTGYISLVGAQLGASLDGEITVKRITVRVDKNWATYDKYSDVIQIGDYSDDCRFFKIEGCNGENQFGLGFYGTSFLPGIRLEGRRFQPQYDTDTDLFRYASGRWQASFVDRKKKLSYYFGRLPEYVLDFLSIVFYFDNCYINGDTVFPADNEFPTIEYDNADDLGALTIDLYNKRDKVRKTVCVGVDADCLPSIVDNVDEPFILTQDNERITTQDLINLYQE